MTHVLGKLLGIALVMVCLLAIFVLMFIVAADHPWAVVLLAFVGLILLGYAGGGLK